MTSNAEILLAEQLRQAGIPFEQEYHFAPAEWAIANGFLTPTGRAKDWRADFFILYAPPVLVEIDGGGYVAGRHSRGAGMEKDSEKQSAAAILGYRVIRCVPAQVEDGRCFSWIQKALGL